MVTLEEKTQAYWNLSRAYEGIEGTTTTEQAIKSLRAILLNVGPSRPLCSAAADLQECIVTGEERPKRCTN